MLPVDEVNPFRPEKGPGDCHNGRQRSQNADESSRAFRRPIMDNNDRDHADFSLGERRPGRGSAPAASTFGEGRERRRTRFRRFAGQSCAGIETAVQSPSLETEVWFVSSASRGKIAVLLLRLDQMFDSHVFLCIGAADLP